MIKEGGVGVTISSQSGHRMSALTPEEDEQLACTPTEELLKLDILQPENIKDTLHAYQMAKRCNEKRVMAERYTLPFNVDRIWRITYNVENFVFKKRMDIHNIQVLDSEADPSYNRYEGGKYSV